MSFSNTIEINKPIDEVFSAVSNFLQYPDIFDHVEEMAKITDGPIEVGTKFKETRLIRGFKAYATLEILTYNPSKQLVVKNEPSGLVIVQDYIFEQTGQGTRVQLTSKVKTKGLRNLLTKPVMTKILKKEDVENLESFKKYIEGVRE
ncbi:hypothetical protein GCM10008967_33670 [Bacillus carboniphilus]|uniref:Polyketide cyclase / dehydrase and lipid transport n=1 Tax=Bacillus carboniphilus TaxID=86663 RepID=A0ABN0WL89_9BACI